MVAHDTIKEPYDETDKSFSYALMRMKAGAKITRPGWFHHFLVLPKGSEYIYLVDHYGESHFWNLNMKDILAEDWIVE